MGLFKKKDKAKKGEEAHDAPAEAEKPSEAAAEGAEGEEAAPKKKGLPLKLIIIAAAALLVVGGGGGGAAYFFLLKPKADAAHAADPAAKEKAEKEKKKKEKKKDEKGAEGKEGEGAGALKEGPDGVYFYSMPTFQVNMQASDGRPTFMKLEVIFEIEDEEIAATIDEQMPRVQDTLQTFLRELRPEDLSGSQGTFRLRQELQRRINLMIAPAKVDKVLLGDMLIT